MTTKNNMNMILFSERQAKSVLKDFNLSITEEKRSKHIVNSEGEYKYCPSCNVEVTMKNMGHIVNGSIEVYCNNPSCLTHYVANRKEK